MIAKGIEDIIDDNSCFHCYSFNLKRFLENEKGLMHIDVGCNKKTKKTYFLYIKTEELGKALTEWTLRKSKNEYYIPKGGD